MKKILSQFELGDMTVAYIADDPRVGMLLAPTTLFDQVAWDKEYAVDSLIQVKALGDAYAGGISNGLTLRNSATVASLRYVEQQVEETEAATAISTTFATDDGQRAIHRLVHRAGCPALISNVTYINGSPEPVSLELLASFSIGSITPFAVGDTPATLRVHRLRARWSSEGRLESLPVEDLLLIPSWARYDQYSEKFGQTGSKPVNRYHPFVAIEDAERQVMWGVQLCAPASWQIELYNRDDALCVSGGLADYDFGHWLKTIAPGERFTTPDAYLTVCQGDLEAICHRLTALQELPLSDLPAGEGDLPIQFNEWATTWGRPTHAGMTALAQTLQGRGVKYLVMDAGWYKKPGLPWDNCAGDWEVSPELFPDGLKAMADAIRAAGLIPGIWFEPEVVCRDADAYGDTAHLLARMGRPLTSGLRRFWDFRQPWVQEHLAHKMIDLLRECGFGYLKIDYNETIGIGCDGAESLGEGLRDQIDAVQAFMRRIRRELPDLVIENCSSGGQRNEPSMMALCSVASFSDTHECVQIPIIAANMQRVILPRQNLVWAVLRQGDSARRLRYSLAATLLGRMCLSGDITRLPAASQRIVDEAIAFYRGAVPVIKRGFSRRYGPPVPNYAHPDGWQAVVRTNDEHALIVIHTFGGELPQRIELPTPAGSKIIASFAGTNTSRVRGSLFEYAPDEDFEGAAYLLARLPETDAARPAA
jgi:alpha-galactosidase